MDGWIYIGGAVLVAVLLWAVSRQKWSPPDSTFAPPQDIAGYRLRPSVLVNRSEQALFTVMANALPPRFHLHAKTRLEDIVTTMPGLDDKTRWRLRGRVKSRHVDFLITDRMGMPLIAIELDGTSHVGAKAAPGDKLKDDVFAQTGLKLKRVHTGDDFDHFAKRLVVWLDINF